MQKGMQVSVNQELDFYFFGRMHWPFLGNNITEAFHILPVSAAKRKSAVHGRRAQVEIGQS